MSWEISETFHRNLWKFPSWNYHREIYSNLSDNLWKVKKI